MKILILGTAESPHIAKIVNTLSVHGHSVKLISMDRQKDFDSQISSKVDIEYIKYRNFLSYYTNALTVRAIYKKYKPDVVNVHYASGYATLARIARIKKVVVSVWGSDVYEFPYRNLLCRHILYRNLRYAKFIASTSNAMARQVEALYPKFGKKIRITPFGVNLNKFRKFKHNTNNVPVVGIVKALRPIYSVDLLIKSFRIVVDKIENTPQLHIYGDGPMRHELELLVEQLGLKQYVFFFGRIDNEHVPEVLNTFDVFVNCSVTESFGTAVVEAMACELPILVTDTPGYSEIIQNEVTGIISKDRNPETIADNIIYLLNGGEKAQILGKNARKTVIDRYEINSNIGDLEKVYFECL